MNPCAEPTGAASRPAFLGKHTRRFVCLGDIQTSWPTLHVRRCMLHPQCLGTEDPLVKNTDTFYLQPLDAGCEREISPRVNNADHMFGTASNVITNHLQHL